MAVLTGRRGHSAVKARSAAVALVVAVLLLVPGSLVGGGGGAFGGVAEAACKYGLTNVYKDWAFKAQVVTNWCYRGGNVTKRKSFPSARVRNAAHAAGWRVGDEEWTYSACHAFHGYSKHNCLTRRQFSFHNIYAPLAPSIGVCIHTRIYGNGAHNRRITTDCTD
jgi:hypothetical protein